ncbi:hypothetical protein CNMCM5793_002070 [Aspergillus hiratsukae]|uniref:Zn(2)-C6 fungal-type domain-containing protein n=1 Tax=Aspergillus hiratsukae TaxID=1194566 RepID=A0A8H6UHF2_9EURO|nr:hypothetical protein CNMCM5793_002070 [Aspergillus hiratsukae]
MNPESSRRSACDRCRGQKLRCVRLANDDPNSLGPCQRCLKAGAECINSLARTRKDLRAQKAQTYHPSYFARLPETPHRHHQQSPPPSRRVFTGQLGQSDEALGGGRPANKSIREHNHVGRVCSNALDSSSSFHLEAGQNQTSGNIGDTTTFIDLLGGVNEAMAVSAANEFDFHTRLSSAAPGDPGQTSGHILTREEAVPLLPTLSADSNPKTSISPREDGLQRLSRLSSSLVQNLARISSVDLADILSYVQDSDSSTVQHRIGTPAASPKNTIGVVIEQSQIFVDILRRLKQQLMPYPSISSAESQCSYSEYWDENPFPLALDGSRRVIPDTTRTKSPGNDTNNTHGSSSSFSSSASTAATSPVPVDMPTTLTILTCYTWLLQSYDAIFAQIYNALARGGSSERIPSILPDLHVGGFTLDNHRDLQVEVLLNLSMEMLQRIEGVLGICVISQRTNIASQPIAASMPARGILDAAPASAVLEIMFKQDNANRSEQNRGDQAWNPNMLKQTIQDIRELLQGGDF